MQFLRSQTALARQITMVCEKCEKKLTKVIVPDKWKAGASNTTEGGGRKINENKLLSKKNRNGLHMEIPSAQSASSKYTKRLSTVTPVLTRKGYVRCVVSKSLIPNFTNKAMYDMEKMDVFYLLLHFLLISLLITSTTVKIFCTLC
ncbi:unnamed protein product [Camellia sinensis]